MKRREFLQTPALLSAAAQQPAQQGADARPNVIWLFADQHRAQALGCNGDANATTPNIDNLAALGVNFTQAASNFPLCCPFRGTLLAGRYAHHCVRGHELPLPDGQPTIAQPFREAGYHTAYFGKWHLAGWQERNGRAAFHITDPRKRGGFDHWVGYDNNNSQWDSWVHGGESRDAFHYRLPGYETDELTSLLIKYVKDRAAEEKAGRAKPFFAVLSVQPPHDPYVEPAEFMSRYNGAKLQLRPNVPNIASVQETARRDLAGYYAMIESWDANIGRVQKALDEAGMGFRTHLIVFSDHGDMHGSHGMYRKTNPFEESVRVPFIIAGEGQRYGGRKTGRVPAMLSGIDIAPTTLGLCGINKPSWMAGYDFSHYRLESRKAAANEPDSTFIQNVIPTGHAHSINKPYRGLVTKDGWKYASFDGHPWILHNLNEDPFEQVNLAHNNRYSAEHKKLAARLRQWVADTGDTFNVV